jgi:peptidoglycan hydrolase-like protein with peptidoglycan-binding domain
MPYALTWLPQTLRAAGLKVAEVPGWTDRGRAEMGRVLGLVCHHTGTQGAGNMPTLRVLIEGRSDLPGPLSQLGLGRDGTYYVVAAGRANHAGAGSWRGVSGNSHFIGIEAENHGDGNDTWPDVQMDAYRRGAAAILKQIGATTDMCCGHKEYAPGRKDDPKGFDCGVFRADVEAILRGVGAVRPLIPAVDGQSRPTLRRGARGALVNVIQAAVGVKEDGVFGPGTEAAVRRFQSDKRAVPDGIVGPKTWVMF